MSTFMMRGQKPYPVFCNELVFETTCEKLETPKVFITITNHFFGSVF